MNINNDTGNSFQMTDKLLSGGIQSVKSAVNTATGGDAVGSGQENVGNLLHNFGDLLKNQMEQINQSQNTADQAQETYALGGKIELHTVMLAVEKADLSMSLAMQIRNKLVTAYQTVSQMSI